MLVYKNDPPSNGLLNWKCIKEKQTKMKFKLSKDNDFFYCSCYYCHEHCQILSSISNILGTLHVLFLNFATHCSLITFLLYVESNLEKGLVSKGSNYSTNQTGSKFALRSSSFPKWLGKTTLNRPHKVCKPRIGALESNKTEAQIHHIASPGQVLMKTRSYSV